MNFIYFKLMIDLKEINTDAQVAFFLVLSEKVLTFIKREEGYKKAKEALEKCWEWIYDKSFPKDDLYELLENDEETALIFQMQFDEDEENMNVENAWNCIIYAVAFTAWKAFKIEGETYLPAPLEMIDCDTAGEFINHLQAIDDSFTHSVNKLTQYLYREYSNFNKEDKAINKTELCLS
ncbi:Imm6 family immunity protein [Fictibacillus sp. Mic-4]|uniref:Imm6 family immunity protein n=1 Tax=Fictibacillus sp. Mic-4 TaxID=3132826 RepID=UPI003CFA0F36